MARDRIKGINIKLGVDTTGLDKALNSIERESKNVKSELGEVNRAIKTTPQSTELWRQKQELLTKAVEESRKKVEFLEDTQKQVQKQFENNEIDNGAYRAFRRELEKARAESENLEEQLENTGKKIYDLESGTENGIKSTNKLGDSMEDAGKKADNMGNEIKNAGGQAENSSDGFTVLKGTLANLAADGIHKVVDAMKDSLEQAQAYEDSIAKLSTIADESASIEKLSDDIMNLSNATGIAADELASTTYDAISAGQSTENAVDFVEKATGLARAGFADTANTIDLLTTILNAYGLESEKVTEVSDILIQTQNKGKTTVAELSSAMGKVIPTANACGVGLDQLAAAYAVMTSNGVATAETTTYLNSMLNELSKSGTKSSDILKEKTGKSFQELIGEGKSLSEILSVISVSADEQNKSFNDMWGSAEAGKAGLILLGDSAENYNKVLGEMQKSTGAMETALEKLNTSSYQFEKAQNKVKNTLISIGSEALKSLMPLIEKALPKVDNGLKKFNDNLPKIEKTAKNTLPLVTGIGTAFLTWKAADTAVKGAEAVTAFAKAVKSGDAVMKLLNTTMLANPAVAVTAAIVGLTGALIAWKLTQEDELTVAEKVAETYEKQHQAAYDASVEMSKLKSSFKDSAETIDIESQRAEELWKELDKLADASGRVKDADKDRAEYILNELNDALGTEYTMTGNQIEDYRTLSQEIDNVIAKKKAEAYLDEYLAMATEFRKNKQQAQEAYEDASIAADAAKAEMDEAEKEFYAIAKGTGLTPEELAKEKDKKGGKWVITDEQFAAADKYLEAKENYAQNQAIKNEERINYIQAMDYFEKLDEAEKALAEARYKDVEEILYAQKDANKEALENAKDFNSEIEKAYQESLGRNTAHLRLALQQNSQAEIDSVLETMGETVKLAKQAGADSTELFTDEMIGGITEMINKGFDISGLTKWGKESGVDVSEVFGENYTKVIQDQLDAGYDITDLLKWGYESGVDVSKKYSDEYYKLVQNRLDQGYDIMELLRWGAGAGFDISCLFTDEFTKKFQSTIDLGFDTGGLMDWAINNGISLGDLFGENFKNRVTQYLYDTDVNHLIQEDYIDSLGEATGNYGPAMNWDPIKKERISRHATGGYIPLGGKGIVADAGPELIELMHGGVRVTPLSGNAQNTPVSAANGGQKVFYNTYNINNPRISSNMDVRKIAQELAAEQRRIENGRGL